MKPANLYFLAKTQISSVWRHPGTPHSEFRTPIFSVDPGLAKPDSQPWRGVINVKWKRQNFGTQARACAGVSFDYARGVSDTINVMTAKGGQRGENILHADYLEYFDCFNRGFYYEAHEVLENLWHPDRKGPNGDFFKGLIQLAGAFVHVQKGRSGPAAALFKLARTNLEKYPATHEQLDVAGVLRLIAAWLKQLDSAGATAVLLTKAPQIHLQ